MKHDTKLWLVFIGFAMCCGVALTVAYFQHTEAMRQPCVCR